MESVPVDFTPTSPPPSLGKLAKALAAAGAEFGAVKRDRVNPYFNSRYATLDSCLSATRPALAKHGLVVVQEASVSARGVTVTTRLLHESGEVLTATPLTAVPKDYGPQGIGSCITYLRRYSLSALLSIAADEDDDGNEAQPAPGQAKQATPPPVPTNGVSQSTPPRTNRQRLTAACDRHGVPYDQVVTILAAQGWPKAATQLTPEQVAQMEENLIPEAASRLAAEEALTNSEGAVGEEVVA